MTTALNASDRRLGFGVDIGGTGIKGAIVDLDTGELVTERFKIATPQPATPDAVASVVKEVMQLAEWDGPVGLTVPSVVRGQVAHTAANIDQAWIGTDLQTLFRKHLGDREIAVLNDADAAGLAEVRLGAPEAAAGAVLLLTFGTGIGSAMLNNGVLFPNTELGHLPFGDTTAERWASSKVREREELTYREWGTRVNQVLQRYAALFNPETFVIGGGISRKFDKFSEYLAVSQQVVPAQLRNQAGIVGATIAVAEGITP